MPNQGHVSRIPGWMVLSGKAAQIAGLAFLARVLGDPGSPAPGPHVEPQQDDQAAPPASPSFITEVADRNARYYRARASGDEYLFAGFYSDGRVRLATSDGRRFSGVMHGEKAVMADLHEDVSFEMAMTAGEQARTVLQMDGGPYAGKVLECVNLS
ncbi:MAG: hypothetical protein M3M96_06235 [Candidatus Eremiobacteraeota bacterium]|nr:hypothetical protein [Candidatus Eremiobacteraeota bacterium]